jgi:hypothetical protein
MNMDNVYRTRDLSLASYLYASKKKLIGLEEDSGRKFLFVFEDTASCQKLVDSFWRREAVVNVKDFSDAMRSLKDLIYSSENR